MPFINDQCKLQTAHAQLERFWREIFWRRQNEQKITFWTIGFFGVMLALVYTKSVELHFPENIIIALFPAVIGYCACSYLRVNWRKHSEIAHIIVKLNESLGTWEKNCFTEDESLYPEKWKTWGTGEFSDDKISYRHFLLVVFATVLTILGIIF